MHGGDQLALAARNAGIARGRGKPLVRRRECSGAVLRCTPGYANTSSVSYENECSTSGAAFVITELCIQI